MKVAHRSASLWGCELKCCTGYYSVTGRGQPPCEAVSWNASKLPWQLAPFVSLLVRLWVEMLSRRQMNGSRPSASLWGCELKFSCWLLLLIRHTVSLLVRLWVEISLCPLASRIRSVSLLVRLWVEMQALLEGNYRAVCQPPCEAVSWNKVATSDDASIAVSLLVRLWVEIHRTIIV